jgi:hypothetical protein
MLPQWQPVYDEELGQWFNSAQEQQAYKNGRGASGGGQDENQAFKSEGYDLLKKLGTGVGPTEQAKYSLEQNLLGRQNQIDAGTRQGAGAMAGARSALASRGGVGFGARERLAQTGAQNEMNMKQGAYRDANSNMLNILKGDQGRRDQALQDFVKTDLDRWGAERQASALEKSAKNSGGGK